MLRGWARSPRRFSSMHPRTIGRPALGQRIQLWAGRHNQAAGRHRVIQPDRLRHQLARANRHAQVAGHLNQNVERDARLAWSSSALRRVSFSTAGVSVILFAPPSPSALPGRLPWLCPCRRRPSIEMLSRSAGQIGGEQRIEVQRQIRRVKFQTQLMLHLPRDRRHRCRAKTGATIRATRPSRRRHRRSRLAERRTRLTIARADSPCNLASDSSGSGPRRRLRPVLSCGASRTSAPHAPDILSTTISLPFSPFKRASNGASWSSFASSSAAFSPPTGARQDIADRLPRHLETTHARRGREASRTMGQNRVARAPASSELGRRRTSHEPRRRSARSCVRVPRWAAVLHPVNPGRGVGVCA